MIAARRLSSLLIALALVAGCRTGPGAAPPGESPEARISRLERSAAGKRAPALAASLAATTYLVTGEPAQATAALEKALAADPAEPLAWTLRGELAREQLDEEGLAEASLATLLKAPNSPWAELAAVRLQQLAQSSAKVDTRIDDTLGSLDDISLGLEGRTAVRAREALLSVRDGRNDEVAADATRRSLGMPSAWTIVGPLGAHGLAAATARSPFDDPKHALAPTYPSPSGEVKTRVVAARDGVLSIEQEPRRGDAFEALVDLEVKHPGEHLISLRGATMATVWVDGVQVLSRRAWPSAAPLRSWGAVELPAGKHRLRVRFTRAEASWFVLMLPRADGGPTSIEMTPPQPGPAPVFASGVKAKPAPGGALGWSEATLTKDPGDPVAAWAQVLALSADDPERAQEALETLVANTGAETMPVRSLRIDLLARDPDLPRATATSLVQRDVDAILARHPEHLRARVLRFDHLRRGKQWDDAALVLEEMQAQLQRPDPQLLLRRARLALDRGDRSTARLAADAALTADPGRCDALDLRTDLARAEDEVRVANELMPQLMRCPGGLAANAAWARGRGRPADAITLLQRLVDRSPSSFVARRGLADALWAAGDLPGAVAALEPAIEAWPRRNDALVHLAYLHDLADEPSKAREYRRRALAVDGSDISLARAVAMEKGTEVLAWGARDGIDAIEGYKAAQLTSNAGAVQVLDLGAFELQPDGSAIERVHSIVKVLDKRGIDQYGEVHLPGDAQAIAVRTVKADGRVLEAEIIAGKDSISMPNLEPGDFVEAEWVRARSPRPAAMPGWQGGMFFFQAPSLPFHESVYEVRAPRSRGLEVEARNVEVSPPDVLEGDVLRFRHTARNVAPFIREPMSVADAELLPWVEAGAGAGEVDLVRQYSEWALLATRPTGEVRRLVKGLASLPVAERLDAVVERVRETVKGDTSSTNFSVGAGHIVAGERGNRLVALSAALSAVGLPSRIVFVRPFSADPQGRRFPRGDYLSLAVLRVDPPGEEPVWIDLSNRYAPVGQLPRSLSGLDALVMPMPGEQPEPVKLPVVDPRQDMTTVLLDLAFDDEGTLVGTMTQRASGFDAAGLRRALERTSLTELKRHQEGQLAAIFPRVVLEDLRVEDSGRPDEPVSLVSTIKAPGYGLRPDGVVALPANFGPAQLGRRFLSRGERKTPLLLSSSMYAETHARLKLPAGASVLVPAPVKESNEFGRYEAEVSVESGVVKFDEVLSLERGRILPERYEAFAAFAAQVDAAQARELPLVAR